MQQHLRFNSKNPDPSILKIPVKIPVNPGPGLFRLSLHQALHLQHGALQAVVAAV